MGTERDDDLISRQIRYYRARAPHYDDWWYRTGRYALAPERKAEWDAEVARLEALIDDWRPSGAVLELAGGTGLWTRRLLRHADSITAVDSSSEAIAINRTRCDDSRISYVEADIFEWTPSRKYDLVFFSFWLSHVPPSRWTSFWEMVRSALVPGGRAMFIDNLWNDGTWFTPSPRRREDPVQSRTDAGDGQEYTVVKLYYEPGELEEELARIGWAAHVDVTGRSFLVGWAQPTERPVARDLGGAIPDA